MADENVIQHDFGFPRVASSADGEVAALYAMLVSLGATRMMAQRLMAKFPDHSPACQRIVDFAADGGGDIRGAITSLRRGRRGAGGAGRHDLTSRHHQNPRRPLDSLDR
jgi:hypothetical protein